MAKIRYIKIFLKLLFCLMLFFLLDNSKNEEQTTINFENRKERLESYNKIGNILILKILNKIYKFPESGFWILSPSENFAKIIYKIYFEQPKLIFKKFLIKEGSTKKQVIKALEEESIIGNIPEIEEGELYPDTYLYSNYTTKEEIINLAKQKMKKEQNTIWNKRAQNYPLTKEEWIVLASIVEKESPCIKEMQIIANVFIKRILVKKRLESCATVLYIFNNILDQQKNTLLYKDLWINSQYNTYRNLGLPPKPISNPSKKALEASINFIPEIEYQFFFHEKGKGYFSKNFEEHIKKQKLLNTIN